MVLTTHSSPSQLGRAIQLLSAGFALVTEEGKVCSCHCSYMETGSY